MELLLNDKQVVGIWRMRGIGKATIAQEVFHQNRNKFDGYYFVENVRETMTKESSNDVRDKIIRQLLRNKSLQEGKCDLYGDGSRIIVTSRDRQVLKYVNSKEGIYEVESLIDSQGLELFSLHAFKQNLPEEGYMKLSKKPTSYAREWISLIDESGNRQGCNKFFLYYHGEYVDEDEDDDDALTHVDEECFVNASFRFSVDDDMEKIIGCGLHKTLPSSLLMASTSSTHPNQWKKWDVFISFRGDDTRYGILSHLSKALKDKQIKTFTDEELHKGEMISPELLKIIRESSVSIVIFSENYADSPWCLDELVEILKCKEESGQIVLPVFYKVDPTDVQKLTGNFGKAFAIATHGEKGSPQKVDNWKRAMMEVSNLSGWDSQNIKYEAELVEKIVNDVLKKFSDMSKSDDSYDTKLIGIKSRVEKVECLLKDKQVVGILGIGGVGKTTIALEVFRRNKNQFNGHYFVENVRETMIKKSSKSARKKIICELLRDKHIDDLNDHVCKRLKSMKVLIVFDDIEDRNHLKDLAGECHLYGEGSRIIITSRNSLGLSIEGIYEVEELIDSQALELFSLHAFEQNRPKEEYKELSKKATIYVGGHPLALKVLGSHLFRRTIEEWESELEKLKGKSLKKIEDVLKRSYDGLEKNEQEIFLDIACFFKGEDKDEVERKLKAFGFYPESGIPRLIEKYLITVSNNRVDMHDLLEQMGKDIVNEECKQPGGRSRLWNYEDIDHVLTTETVRTKLINEALIIIIFEFCKNCRSRDELSINQ
ncbi:disease resistance protein RUN1-like [Hevea brasiliensis]|uniref:disease resistance protein RUN1-like n=1 Tax=Hevea brasiliensis TaxID=3981 RepID=UPI0025D1C891|nr:disease resistance protein RUN1-like [Hevea brasiliensis]